MTAATFKDLHPQTWKDLYHAAIESDLTKLPDRTTDAESR